MTTPDTEKLLAKIEALAQIAEEIATMTDFNPQDSWEAGFDEAIAAVIVRIKEQMQNLVKETEN